MNRIAKIISIILFIIPFFWLRPGEMDLGGDTSRLYFYDPFSYLHTQTLYSVVSSGIGGAAISYYALPHFLLLAILRLIVSPTILISISNGLNLSLAFISCYLIVKELADSKETENTYREKLLECSAILAGLFYIFSPYLILGWDRTLLTHNQIFLNPLMFFLLLRYFITHKIKYLLGMLLTTFVFSPNFTYVAAPPFFAFYPLSFVFLLLYTKYIRKIRIPAKGLLIGIIIFILLHTFHLLPQIVGLFSAGAGIHEAVFSTQAKFSRGLDYFSAIAPSIKISISWMDLAQVAKPGILSYLFIIFPLIILVSFLWNKGKIFLLTGIFFLIAFFFATANITNVGFNFYKLLFYIPGFSMFRNFYGQWGFVFVFFYAILAGQSLVIVLSRIKKRYLYFLTVFIAGLLIANAWPFINGSLIRLPLYQLKDINPVIRMDSKYKDVLEFVRSFPVDGKVLSLPLVGPGYQVLAGKDGGLYIGPSTFSYLAGKNDFTGYGGLGPYGEFFLQTVHDQDYFSLQRLLQILNIKYIFYNSDQDIYDNILSASIYDYVKDFLPKSQQSYKEFIEQLPVDIDKKIDFGDKYHLYPIKDNLFIPHIYTTDKITYTNKPSTLPLISYFSDTPRFAIFYINDSQDKKDNVILEAESDSPLLELKNNYHLHHHEPFISLRLDDIRYPLALWREKFELWKLRNKHGQYLDFSLFYLSKRILELEKWKKEILVTGKPWEEPKIWEFYKWRDYNSWEASLARYQKGMEELIQRVNEVKESKSWIQANKIKINEQLLQHKITLINIIRATNKNDDEKNYLRSLIDNTFNSLFKKLDLNLYASSSLTYNLRVPKNHSGEYEVYLDKKENESSNLSQASIELDGKVLRPIKNNSGDDFLQFDNVVIENQEETAIALHLQPENLIKDTHWENSGSQKEATNSAIIEINNISGDNSGGLIKEINGWLPNKQYVISFDYITFGDDFTLKFFDKQIKGEKKSEALGTIYFVKNLNSREWSTHQSVLTSDLNSTAAFIQIMGSQEVIKSVIYIRNLSVIEVIYPKIFFKKVMPEKIEEAVPPRIIFEKINPTKYRIKVMDADNPYTLTFLEAFDNNWRLVDPERDDKMLIGSLSRFTGNVGKTIVGFFIKDRRPDEKIAASHFEDNIKEGVNRNTFLEPETFETWGRKSIAEDRHFRANGYANAWNIVPSDMDGKTDYVLILEMTTQNQFYLFLFVSLSTGFFLFIYFWIALFKNK